MCHDVQLLQCNDVAEAPTEISHSAVSCMNLMIKPFIRRDPIKHNQPIANGDETQYRYASFAADLLPTKLEEYQYFQLCRVPASQALI